MADINFKGTVDALFQGMNGIVSSKKMCIRDRHGTAIITLAGLMNALKVTGRELDKVKIVMNGAGARCV